MVFSRGSAVNFYFEKNNYQIDVGETVDIKVKIDAGKKKVDLALVEMDYSSGLEIKDIDLGDLPDELGVSTGGGKISIKAVKMSNWQSLPSGKFDLATITVGAKSSGNISFNTTQSNGCIPNGNDCQVSGFETTTGEDVNITVGSNGQGITSKIMKWFLRMLGL